jgi:hypothetical protein
MTQTSNKLFDDFAKLLTNAAGAAQGVRREIDTVMRSQAERILNELDVVSREEFDAVRDMAAKAREENERLERRIGELEAALKATAAAAPKPAARKKPAQSASDKTGDPSA